MKESSMRKRRIVKRAAAHLCVICGILSAAVWILDWYNPYMDFLGHAGAVLSLLCFCSVASGFLYIFDEGHPGRDRHGRGNGGGERR